MAWKQNFLTNPLKSILFLLNLNFILVIVQADEKDNKIFKFYDRFAWGTIERLSMTSIQLYAEISSTSLRKDLFVNKFITIFENFIYFYLSLIFHWFWFWIIFKI